MTVIPDQNTIKILPWLEKTALVLGDAFEQDGKTPVNHSTRQILREAISKANKMGFEPMLGSELEFFLFKQTYDEIHANNYKNLKETSKIKNLFIYDKKFKKIIDQIAESQNKGNNNDN